LPDPVKPTLLQALADRRMASILLLSFASGLPLNLTGSTLQAWLTESGLDIKTIGIFGLVSLPYVFKFLWAPLLDRYLPPLLGRRRGWILIYQGALAIAIAGMGWCSPERSTTVLGLVAIGVAFLSASQDIAIDAYRVDVIPPRERALASTPTAFGYRSAAMFAGTFTLIIAAQLGWRVAYGLVGVVMALTILATLWAPEPVTPGQPPRTLTDAVLLPLLDLLKKKGAWGFLLLILLYKVGDAFALSLYSTFMLRGMGFTLRELSIGGKLNMTLSTMLGTALGGWAYLRWGLFRTLLTFGVVQALTNLLYLWLALAGRKFWLMVLATCLDNLAGGMGQAAFVAFIMAQCSVNFSATQYALLSALASIPRTTISAVAGPVVAAIGWPKFFVVTFATAMPGLLLLVILRRRILELERRDEARPVAGSPGSSRLSGS
jgi:PAT family beta-lactamase induction signal transducer AmpG